MSEKLKKAATLSMEVDKLFSQLHNGLANTIDTPQDS
jgi:putative GTP pyrophosphokinase